MPKDINKLTDKQKAFAEAYTDNTGTVSINGEDKQTFNHATRSAIKAGYKNNAMTANIASRNLAMPKIRAYMDQIREAYKSRQTIGLDWAKQQYIAKYEAWEKDDHTNAKGCLDSFVRMHGGFTDNLNTGKQETETVPEADKAAYDDTVAQLKIRLSKDRLTG